MAGAGRAGVLGVLSVRAPRVDAARARGGRLGASARGAWAGLEGGSASPTPAPRAVTESDDADGQAGRVQVARHSCVVNYGRQIGVDRNGVVAVVCSGGGAAAGGGAAQGRPPRRRRASGARAGGLGAASGRRPGGAAASRRGRPPRAAAADSAAATRRRLSYCAWAGVGRWGPRGGGHPPRGAPRVGVGVGGPVARPRGWGRVRASGWGGARRARAPPRPAPRVGTEGGDAPRGGGTCEGSRVY